MKIDCKCVALVNKHTHESDGILFCPLHKAAPTLLTACKDARLILSKHVGQKAGGIIERLERAIAKAQARP